MEATYNYNLTFGANTVGLRDAIASMQSMSQGAMSAQYAFQSVESVSRLGAAGILQMVQAVRALGMAFMTNPVTAAITGIVVALSVAISAWQRYKRHVEETAEAQKKAAAEARAAAAEATRFSEALDKIVNAPITLSLSDQIEAVKKLTQAFSDASAAIERNAAAQSTLGRATAEAEMAQIDLSLAEAMRSAKGDPRAQSEATFNAALARNAAKERARNLEINAARAALDEQEKLLKKEIDVQERRAKYGLGVHGGTFIRARQRQAEISAKMEKLAPGMAPEDVTQKYFLSRTDVDTAKANAAEYLKLASALKEAQKEYDAMLDQSDQAKAEAQAALPVLKGELAALESKKQALEQSAQASHDAASADHYRALAAKEAADRTNDEKEAAEKLAEAKKKEAEETKRANKEKSDAAREYADVQAQLKDALADAEKKAESSFAYAMDPAARAEADAASKAEARQERLFQSRLKIAQRAQEEGRKLMPWQQRILDAQAAREAEKTLKDTSAADALAKRSADDLNSIKENTNAIAESLNAALRCT